MDKKKKGYSGNFFQLNFRLSRNCLFLGFEHGYITNATYVAQLV